MHEMCKKSSKFLWFNCQVKQNLAHFKYARYPVQRPWIHYAEVWGECHYENGNTTTRYSGLIVIKFHAFSIVIFQVYKISGLQTQDTTASKQCNYILFKKYKMTRDKLCK